METLFVASASTFAAGPPVWLHLSTVFCRNQPQCEWKGKHMSMWNSQSWINTDNQTNNICIYTIIHIYLSRYIPHWSIGGKPQGQTDSYINHPLRHSKPLDWWGSWRLLPWFWVHVEGQLSEIRRQLHTETACAPQIWLTCAQCTVNHLFGSQPPLSCSSCCSSSVFTLFRRVLSVYALPSWNPLHLLRGAQALQLCFDCLACWPLSVLFLLWKCAG